MSWEVVIDYEDAGYVKDDEKIDADALIKSFREGAVEQNKEREKHGFPPLSVGELDRGARATTWPRRTALIWALPATSTHGTTINYNTRVLGRRGYVSLNLLSGADRIATEKSNAATLLAATTFKNGARYEDFNKKTDKVAEYGLMGLILGGAGIAAVKVAKVGLLAGLAQVPHRRLEDRRRLLHRDRRRIEASRAIGQARRPRRKRRSSRRRAPTVTPF